MGTPTKATALEIKEWDETESLGEIPKDIRSGIYCLFF